MALSFSRQRRIDPAQVLGKLGIKLARVPRPLALVLHADRERRVALERHTARHHLEEDDPQRIDIRALVDLLPLDLLRRHVLRRPDHHPGARDPFPPERPGDPEVHDPGVPVLVHHDVLGLQVAVDDPEVMGLRQAFAHLLGDRNGPARPELARSSG